jgi:hypothetical protein
MEMAARVPTRDVAQRLRGVLTVVSPGLKVLFERVGRPEVINRPEFFRFDGMGRSSPAITLAGRTAYGPALYVKAGAFRFDVVTIGLGTRRFRSD